MNDDFFSKDNKDTVNVDTVLDKLREIKLDTDSSISKAYEVVKSLDMELVMSRVTLKREVKKVVDAYP
jgi:hypothetical protein